VCMSVCLVCRICYICSCMCVCACVHACVRVCAHTHIRYTYIHICTYMEEPSRSQRLLQQTFNEMTPPPLIMQFDRHTSYICCMYAYIYHVHVFVCIHTHTHTHHTRTQSPLRQTHQARTRLLFHRTSLPTPNQLHLHL
jgi:hypothetical protein